MISPSTYFGSFLLYPTEEVVSLDPLDGDFEKTGSFIFSSFVAEIKSVNINEDKARAEKKDGFLFEYYGFNCRCYDVRDIQIGCHNGL